MEQQDGQEMKSSLPNLSLSKHKWNGLLSGAIRQLDKETDQRDERLEARDDILAEALGVSFNNLEKGISTRKIIDCGTVDMTNTELWISFSEEFTVELNDDIIPVVTVTPNCPGVVLCITEKDNTGFRVMGISGSGEFSFDWIAVAKIRLTKTDDSVEHLDDVFFREFKEIPKDAFPVAMPMPTIQKDEEGNVTALPYPYQDKMDIPEGVEIYQASLPDLSPVEGFNEKIGTQSKQAYFDASGSQIPPEWVDTLRTLGLEMFTYEEIQQRRFESYLKQLNPPDKSAEKEKLSGQKAKFVSDRATSEGIITKSINQISTGQNENLNIKTTGPKETQERIIKEENDNIDN